jgi:hypothetical protein
MSSGSLLGCGSGRSFSNELLYFSFFLHIFIQHLFRAKGILIPHLHKALPLPAILATTQKL